MKREEAIQNIKKLLGFSDTLDESIFTLFPELKESEDERIRKELIAFLKENHETGRAEETWSLSGIERWIAWLEKQKVITEGDFGRGYDCGYQAGYAVAMNEMEPKVAMATLDSEKQKDSVSNAKYIEDVAHAFEDGRKKGIEEKQKEQKPSINIDQLKSLMLQYLQEAANEKDDSAIEADTDKWARKILGYDFEQKPAEWSKEDENKLNHILEIVHIASGREVSVDEKEELESFLKSFRPQPQQEWSEEDEEMYARIVRRYTDYEGVIMRTKEESIANKILDAMAQEEIWLKSLRPQLKVEAEPVDLEKEIQRYLCEECSSDDEPTIKEIAHHFYKLGLNARKEE